MSRFICFGICVLAAFSVTVPAYEWTETSALPEGRTGHSLVYYNGYVYCLGGRADGTVEQNRGVDTVFYASVNADGSIGAWVAGPVLPASRANGGAAAWDGYLYYWGGWDQTYATQNTCFYAPLAGDGSIGAWVTSSVTIPDAAGQAYADAFGSDGLCVNGYLYIINGENNNGTRQDAVYYSQIQAGHDFGTWTATTSTDNASWFHGNVFYEGPSTTWIYRVGGNLGGTTESFLRKAVFNGDGTVGAWEPTTGELAEACYEHGCVIADGKIFTIGGLSGGDPIDVVQSGEISDATGDVASFVIDASPYPQALARMRAITYDIPGGVAILGVSGGAYGSTGPRQPNCYYTAIQIGPTPTPTVTPTPTDTPVIAGTDRWNDYR